MPIGLEYGFIPSVALELVVTDTIAAPLNVMIAFPCVMTVGPR